MPPVKNAYGLFYGVKTGRDTGGFLLGEIT